MASSVTGVFTGFGGLEVDAEELAGLVGRVSVMLLHHLDDADDLLADIGVIEEGAVARFFIFIRLSLAA